MVTLTTNMDSYENSYESDREDCEDEIDTVVMNELDRDDNVDTSTFVKEYDQSSIFDAMVRYDHAFEERTKIDYSLLDEDSRGLVMEEIIERMIVFAMRASSRTELIGWYPYSYSEYLKTCCARGYISSEDYYHIVSLIEDCLLNNSIPFTEKMNELADFSNVSVDTLKKNILIAWNPMIEMRTQVVNVQLLPTDRKHTIVTCVSESFLSQEFA